MGWMSKYRKLVAYAKEDRTVPPKSHPELGNWVDHQRRAKRGQGHGKMTEARSRLLESIKNAKGKIVWVWDVDNEAQWMEKYRKVVAYAKKDGTVPPSNHPELGTWVNTQRKAKRGQGTAKMTEARSRLLESIKNAQGKIVWVWDVDNEAQWMEMYLKLKSYVEEHETVPSQSHSELGMWVTDQRSAKRGKGTGKMTPGRIALLKGLTNKDGKRVWVWDVDGEAQWMASFDDLVAYLGKYEKMPTQTSYRKLATWVNNQRQAKRGAPKLKMTDKRIKLLAALPGWKWEGRFPSPAEMKTLIAKARKNGTFPPPRPTGHALDPEAVEATGKTAPGSVASAATPQGEARAAQVEVEVGVETAVEVEVDVETAPEVQVETEVQVEVQVETAPEVDTARAAVASKKRRKDSPSTSGPALGNEALAAETAQVSELKEKIKWLEERVKSLEDALAARDEQTNCGKRASSPPENLSSGDGRSPSSKRPRTTTTPAWLASSVQKRRRRTIESDSSDDDDDSM